ncbi:MAG TPA: UDP-N-acetylmuramyl pentapeptide phosphotransferase, partial [Isosphaeraceae bacterium]
MGHLLLACALAALGSGLLAFPVRRLALRLGVVDRPNARSSHRAPTPRAGGVALVLALAATVLVLVPIRPEGLAAGLLIAAVAAVSLVDDVRSLSFAPRLAVQVIAAVGVVWLLEVPARAVDLPGWDAAPPRGWGAA